MYDALKSFAKRYSKAERTYKTYQAMHRWVWSQENLSHPALVEIATILRVGGMAEADVTLKVWDALQLCLDELMGLPVPTTAAERHKARIIARSRHCLETASPEQMETRRIEVRDALLRLDPNFDLSILGL